MITPNIVLNQFKISALFTAWSTICVLISQSIYKELETIPAVISVFSTTSFQHFISIAPPFTFPFTLDLFITIFTFATSVFLKKTLINAGSLTSGKMWFMVNQFEKYCIIKFNELKKCQSTKVVKCNWQLAQYWTIYHLAIPFLLCPWRCLISWWCRHKMVFLACTCVRATSVNEIHHHLTLHDLHTWENLQNLLRHLF